MDLFVAIVGRLSRLSGMLAAALLAAAVLVVCQMVVWRYALGLSTVWQTEFVTYALVASAFIGTPYVALIRGHVNVDLLPLALGARGRMILALTVSLLALAFAVLVCVTGAMLWLEAWENGWHSDTVWAPPLWIPYLPMPVGFGLLALQYVADILSLARGEALPFGLPAEEMR